MKRKQITIGLVILAVAAICVIIVEISRSSVSKPITFADAQQQARGQQNFPNCLASSNQNIPPDALKGISSVVGAKLIDVPRGTAYSLFFNSYNSQKASGTIVYDGAGNTFNFAVNRSNNKWQLTSFGACDQSS
jgi:hypothetical protein